VQMFIALLTYAAFSAAANAQVSQNLPRFDFDVPGGLLRVTAMTVDAQGYTYLTGTVTGSPFTATPGAYQMYNNGSGTLCFGGAVGGVPLLVPCPNAFVIKLDPSGAIFYATYLGGQGDSAGSAIVADAAGNAYVAGSLSPTGVENPPPPQPFPVTPGAAYSSGTGFIAKLNSSGTQLLYSTMIPGAGPSAIIANSQGEAYFAGTFENADGKYPGAAAKLNATGTGIEWSTFLPVSSLGSLSATGVALDTGGNVLIAGTGGYGGSNADLIPFLAKVSADGTTVLSTLVLGSGGYASAVKAAPSGDIYVECGFFGPDFPAAAQGFDTAIPAQAAGGANSYLMHVSADASTLLSAIYLPFGAPSAYAAIGSVASVFDVDAAGNAYVAGNVFGSGPVPASEGAFQPAYQPIDGGAGVDGIVAKITPAGDIAGVTYFGGFGTGLSGIGVERDGSVVVGGPTAQGTTNANPGFFVANLFPAITLENAASYAAGSVAAGEIVTLEGYGIGPAQGVVSPPAASVGGVQVYFDSFAAPVIYAQANQINAQAPWEIAGQASTLVRIVFNGVEVGRATVPVSAASPGIFSVVNANGSTNSGANPAHAGEVVSLFGTGGGVMSPAGVDGMSWPLMPLSTMTQSVSATVGGAAATATYAGSAPTLDSGFFQINVRVPSGLTPGSQALYLTIGGIAGVPVVISIE
jgi:uncharacterized protein (TIGR03437 family)